MLQYGLHLRIMLAQVRFSREAHSNKESLAFLFLAFDFLGSTASNNRTNGKEKAACSGPPS